MVSLFVVYGRPLFLLLLQHVVSISAIQSLSVAVEALCLVLAEEVEAEAVLAVGVEVADGDGGFELDNWFCLVLSEDHCLY
jgi:hypothetical protein